MDRKIAILTLYYRNYNSGGQLQAYALQKVLEKAGYDCRQIAFQRDRKEVALRKIRSFLRDSAAERKKFFLARANRVLRILRREPTGTVTFRKFDEWAERIPHTETVTRQTIGKLNADFDTFIVGSDQVWNPEYVPMTFFLDFTEDGKKRISYAASIRQEKYEKKEGREIRRLVERFDAVSVLERAAVKVLRDIGVGKEITVDLDPTLLLTAEDWDEAAVKPETDQDYVFSYLVKDPRALDGIRAFAQERGCRVISVNNPGYVTRDDDVFLRIRTGVGPAEFLGLMKHAKYVFVDSFHGLVFSLIYRKPFLVFGEKTDDRKVTLLELAGMPDRMIPPGTGKEGYRFEGMDFEEAARRIGEAREISMKRLFASI